MTQAEKFRSKRNPVRVLFLRSYAKAPFAAAIAGGLHSSHEIETWQYPPWPEESLSKLEKLPNAQNAWTDLHTRLIPNSKVLLEKIHSGFFDLAVLSDEDGQLIGTCSNKNTFPKRLYNSIATFLYWASNRVAYPKSLPISLADIAAIMPVAVVDRDDKPFLTVASQHYLQTCCTYFKRELPFDRFFLFYHQRPSPWKIRRKELLPVVDKVYGVPLGIEDLTYTALKRQRVENQPIDVLFVGSITNTLRQLGLDRLRKWAAKRSYKVEIRDSLPYDEYCRMTADSKVTISIAGGGWDCFRHYEAVALGSVPLMNRPTVDAVFWHSMPSAVFFDNTFCDFDIQLDNLVANSDLRQKSFTILDHQEKYYFLHSKIAEYIVHTTLERGSLTRSE